MGALGKMKKTKKLDAPALATTLAKEQRTVIKKDKNDLLGSVLGMLGGSASTTSGGGMDLGGILGAVGGLFKKKK